MKKKIVIAGGTGFIGRYLKSRFTEDGFDVFIISRGIGNINWNDSVSMNAALEDAEALINLAGKSVDCRYNKRNRSEILASRIQTTRALQAATDQCMNPPKLWINSSTATIYRHSEDKAMDESILAK